MRRITAAVAVLAIAVAAGCGTEEHTGPQKLDLQIANLLPVTGFLDQFGKPGRRASDTALEEIRKAAAKAGAQHTVSMRNIDYKSDPVYAVKVAGELQKKGTDCLTGPWGSGQASRVGAVVGTPNRMLVITPSGSAEQVSQVKDRGFFNSMVPPDKLQATALVELMSRQLDGTKGKKVNIGASESPYGQELTKAFKEQWTDRKGVIGNIATYRGDQTSLAAPIQALGQGKPDAWVFFDFADVYVRVALELLQDKKSGFKPNKVFGTDSLANPRLPNIGPTVSDGLMGVAISAPTKGKVADTFDSAFKRVPGSHRQTFDAQQFDAVILCYLSAVAAGTTNAADMKDKLGPVSAPPGKKYTWLELDKAIKALEAGQDIDYEGVSGPINLNKAGVATAGVYDVYKVQNGALKVVDQIAVPLGASGI